MERTKGKGYKLHWGRFHTDITTTTKNYSENNVSQGLSGVPITEVLKIRVDWVLDNWLNQVIF